MALGKLLGKVFGNTTSVELKEFECGDCGSSFNSAKQPDRASCPDCLSNNVTVIGTVDRDA